MSELYPLIFTPILKQYLWGGRNLEKLGRVIPPNIKVAESWEISSHADGMTLVSNGHFAGKNLSELLTILGVDLVGTRNLWALERGIFPHLVKLLDAEDNLSIQVHPDDDYAREHVSDTELGKSEMWVVLDAKPEAAVIFGFSEELTTETFQGLIEKGTLERSLNYIKVKPGDHLCVPPGTLHAILKGVLLAEIQQNSNTTFRVYDWGRTDDHGRARELHIAKALDVINFQQVNEQLPKAKIIDKNERFQRELLCVSPYFTVERLTFYQNFEYFGECDGSSLEIWGVVYGCAEIEGLLMDQVGFTLLPAGL